MPFKALCFATVLVLLSCGTSSAKTPELPKPKLSKLELHVKPEELAALVIGQQVDFYLKNGNYVRGKVVNGDSQQLVVQVRKAIPTIIVAGPTSTVPLSEIAVAQFKKGSKPSRVRKAIGASLGFVGGIVVGLPLAYTDTVSGGILGIFFVYTGPVFGAIISGHPQTLLTVYLDDSIAPLGPSESCLTSPSDCIRRIESSVALVSLDSIQEVFPMASGHGGVPLKNGVRLEVNRRRFKELREKLEA